MKEFSFSSWIKKINEWADFGFTRPNDTKNPIDMDENPIPSHNINLIIKELRKLGIGVKNAKQDDFFAEVNWGEGPGALRVVINPFGGLRASLKKQTKDLQGNSTWVAYKVIGIPDKSNPEEIVEKIIKNLRMIDKENIPAPKKVSYDLERLAVEIAEGVNRYSKQRILLYESIRIVRPQREYIVNYGVTGMGRQAEGQKRVDSVQIFVKFEEQTGVITVGVNELGDAIGQHKWQYYPSEILEKFTPTQDRKIIVDCMINSITAIYGVFENETYNKYK